MGLKGWFVKAKAWTLASDLTNIVGSVKAQLAEITRATGADDATREQFDNLFVVNYDKTREFI